MALRIQHVASGVWRIGVAAPDVQAPGASVLLARRAARPLWPRPLLDHPRVLKVYGEHGERARDTLVCEEGQLLDAFLAPGVSRGAAAGVLRDVLVGLCGLHDHGFAHGRVDAHHIIVGVDGKGNLLAPFWCGVAPEASEEDAAANSVHFRIAQDLVAFARCAADTLAPHEGDTQLERARRLLAGVIARGDTLEAAAAAKKVAASLVRVLSRLASV